MDTDNPLMEDEFDASVMEMIRTAGGDSLLKDLIEIFLDDAPIKIAEMKDAAGHGDCRRAALAAHPLIGITGNLGANKMMATAQKIDDHDAGHTIDELTDLIDNLEKSFSNVKIRLLQEISG